MAYGMMRNAHNDFLTELDTEYLYDSVFDTSKNLRDSKTIFIAIPCYRDPEVLNTIKSAILNAKNPDRLVFGVGLVYLKGDEKWWEPLLSNPQVKLDVKEANVKNIGLGNQRADANSFYNKEDFYLQLDAHMRFDMYWDDLLIHHYNILKGLGEEKPLITGYPRSYAPNTYDNVLGHYPYYNPKSKEDYFRQRRGHNNIPCFRHGLKPARFFEEFGFPRHGDRIFTRFEALALSVAVSPAQIFTAGSFVTDVPANRKIMFFEEEQYYSILGWMKGYNFYVPRVTGIMHFYSEALGQVLLNRQDRPHPEYDFPDVFGPEQYQIKDACKVVFDPIKKLKNTKRSFSDYENFAGINYEARRINSPVNKMIHNSITEVVNFGAELYTYSTNDYIDWMYDADYPWYEDVQRNETQA
jgi:hypothetical protein